jgi:hypothetical protein
MLHSSVIQQFVRILTVVTRLTGLVTDDQMTTSFCVMMAHEKTSTPGATAI